MICLSKDYSGLEKDINIKFGSKNWKYGGEYNLKLLCKMYGIDSIDSIAVKYRKILTDLNLKNNNIDYRNMLGTQLYRKRIDEIKNSLDNLLQRINLNYLSVLEKRVTFTNSFSSFIFKNNMYEKLEYDHYTSVTGRVKISGSKINFLTMKKEDRKYLSSSFANGKLYIIDIVSLEPRILLSLINKDNSGDIYQNIIDDMKLSAPRSKVKLGVLSCIYGGNDKTIKNVSGLNSNDILKIKNYFDIKSLSSDLMQRDDIHNFYGRKIKKSKAVVNHMIQSTAADCACLAFSEYLNSKNSEKIKCIAFIHDAIIIDVECSYADNIINTKSIYEPNLNIKLPVTVEEIS